MIPLLSRILCGVGLTISLSFDAAVEEFLIESSRINPASLDGAIGVYSITFAELNYAAEMDMPPASVQTFDPQSNYFSENKQVLPALTVNNTKAISGIEYSGLILRRFPIVERKESLIRIVYDSEKNLRAWVQQVDNNYVRTNVGQLIPATAFFFADRKNTSVTMDIFYLLNGKPRLFYEKPDAAARTVAVANPQHMHLIPWSATSKEISGFLVTEIENGFAKVSTWHGADGEPVFAGWVKIFDGDKLTVWEFAMGGC